MECLETQNFRDFHVVVVDHGADPIVRKNYPQKWISFVREDSDLWWTGAVNRGVRHVLDVARCTDYILIINDDVVFGPDYLSTMVDSAMNNPSALIGSACIEFDNIYDAESALCLNRFRARFEGRKIQTGAASINNNDVASDVLSGRGMLAPVSVFKEIGLFDERNLPHYAADYEFSWRARQRGYPLRCELRCPLYTQSEEAARWDYKGSARQFFMNRKRPNNVKTVIAFSRLCFGPVYRLYYIAVNILLLMASFLKKRFLILTHKQIDKESE